MSPWPALSTASEARDAALRGLGEALETRRTPGRSAPSSLDDLRGAAHPRPEPATPPTGAHVAVCTHGVRLRDRCPVCEPVTRTGWSGFAPSDLPTTQTHRSPALVRECVQRALYRLRARTALDEAVGAFERHLAVLTPDAPGLEAVEAALSKLDQARKILESDSFFKSGPRL